MESIKSMQHKLRQVKEKLSSDDELNKNELLDLINLVEENVTSILETLSTLSFSEMTVGDENGNNCEISSKGFITLNGEACGYDDLKLPLLVKATGANRPTLATLIGSIKGYTWAVDDYTDIDSTEQDHKFAVGSTGQLHMHLYTNGVDVEDKKVNVQFKYTYDNFDGVATEKAIEFEATIPADTPDRTHLIFDIGEITSLNPGSQISGVFKRIASSNEPTANPFIQGLHIHFPVDTPAGSHTMQEK